MPSAVGALGARPAVEWLGATSIHSEDATLAPLVGALVALCDTYPQLEMLVNLFDAAPGPSGGAAALVAGLAGNHSRVGGTGVPGMKTLFWKQVLTPARTRGLRAVWVFDCDIAVATCARRQRHTSCRVVHCPLRLSRVRG